MNTTKPTTRKKTKKKCMDNVVYDSRTLESRLYLFRSIQNGNVLSERTVSSVKSEQGAALVIYYGMVHLTLPIGLKRTNNMSFVYACVRVSVSACLRVYDVHAICLFFAWKKSESFPFVKAA